MGRVIRSLKHGWSLFKDEPQNTIAPARGSAYSPRQQRSPVRYYNDRSIVNSILTRLAVDCAGVEFNHVVLDLNSNVVKSVRYDSPLQNCLTVEANIDQNALAFKVDLFMTLFETGYAAVVPTEADIDITKTGAYQVYSMRVGRILQWAPRQVLVEVYDDRDVDGDGNPVGGGIHRQIWMEKKLVAIIENPFYSTMNEPNGVLQRLKAKLAILDSIDEAAGSGKLDLIMQLPYAVRGTNRKAQAEARRDELLSQLKDDELGIGYIDVSEKVIQLNRPIDNKLLAQIEYLYAQVFSQLGLTPEIMNNTASRETMDAYYDRTIEPVTNTVALEFKRKFLTKTARTQRQSVETYRDPLALIGLKELPEVADKLIRNAVVTANELRPKIGFPPSSQPGADKLINPNMPVSDQTPEGVNNGQQPPEPPRVVSEGGVTPPPQRPDGGGDPQP